MDKQRGGTSKTQHKSRASSGLRHQWKARQEIRVLTIKINRWENNQSNPAKKEAGKSRNGWDTAPMYKHIQRLEAVLKQPAKRPS